MSSKIYFDNSTTAKPSPSAVSAMMPYFTERWGATTAPHAQGQQLFPALEESMRSLYRLLGANEEADDLIVTSSGAEAVNHVIQSVYHSDTRNLGKNQFLTSRIDEAPAIVACGRLEEYGCVSKMVPVDKNGTVSVEALAESLSPRTALLSLSWGCGLTGVIQNLQPLRELCRDRGVLFHVDVTHAIGKLHFDLNLLDPDFVTFNGEQIHAPQGTGVLLVRNKKNLSPFILGGTEQAGLRAGSLNIAGLVGLGVAADELVQARDYLCTEVARLRNRLEQGIVEVFPDAFPTFKDQARLPHVSTMIFPGITNELMAFALDRVGIAVSIGGGTLQQVGMLLQACGFDEERAHSAISFSLSRYTTDEEVEQAIEAIGEMTSRYKPLSESIQVETEV